MKALSIINVDVDVKGKDKPEDRQGVVDKIKCSDYQATYIGETGKHLTTWLSEHKRATKKGDLNNIILITTCYIRPLIYNT